MEEDGRAGKAEVRPFEGPADEGPARGPVEDDEEPAA